MGLDRLDGNGDGNGNRMGTVVEILLMAVEMVNGDEPYFSLFQ